MPIKKSAFLAAVDDYYGATRTIEAVNCRIAELADEIAEYSTRRSGALQRQLAALDILRRSMTKEAFAEMVGYRNLQDG